MTTETTTIDKAISIINNQRDLINSYSTLLASYDKRQESMVAYLKTIHALLEAGINNPQYTKDAQLGLEHLNRLITRMNTKKEVA